MMKRMVTSLLFIFCLSVAYAGYNDGLISVGEYEYGIDWLNGLLVVNGGGADVIEVLNSAQIEVWSTSTPLGLDVGGIQYIDLKNNSRLDYYGGETFSITIGNNATAHLHDGRIDYLTSYQHVNWVNGQPKDQHVNIYCQDGWSWLYTSSQITGITGLWRDGSAFNISFVDKQYLGFDPVWANINVIPEPATLALLGLGGILLRKRKQ